MPAVPVYSDSNSPSKIRGGQGALNNQEAIESSQTALNNQEKTVKTTQVFNTPAMKAHRRELRNNSTPAEKALWNLLKGKQIKGLQFRRQFSVGQHILDFYCPLLRLCIELDGDVHKSPMADVKDDIRTKYLNEQGITVMRFWNETVWRNPQGIIEEIINFGKGRK